MALATEFVPLQLDRLRDTAHRMKDEGWRFIQTHAAYNEPNVDLYYSFMKDGNVVNYRIEGVTKEDPVPSITDIFLAAFVFENEARELFGVDMRDIAIDFDGALYAPAVSEPMTIITPEQKAAREKARKAAARKDAVKPDGQGTSAAAEGAAGAGGGFAMSEEKLQKLEAKLATMSPDKVAKVRAALAARQEKAAAAVGDAGAGEAAKAQPEASEGEVLAAKDDKGMQEGPGARDAQLEAKLAAMDPQKAAKVRSILAGGSAPAESDGGQGAVETAATSDSAVESKLALMEKAKARKVRAALATAAGKRAAAARGE
ncbi:MAG TPA: NADH:ubiquinone oxidoreductase [Eggerthellaceae bacterium]|nr:NADH:ubiquinone oxidoreductase [Eggerthellaceae bacterium]